jgi:hypothetical protein
MLAGVLLFPDSEIAVVQVRGSGLRMRFSAAHVRRTAPGAAAEDGYLPGAELHWLQARWEGSPLQSCIGPLADSQWWDGAALRRWLPLAPAHEAFGGAAAGVEGHFEFRNGERLRVCAQALRIVLPEGPRFLESFAC